MGLTRYDFSIKGISVPVPKDWKGVDIGGNFDNDALQPNILTDTFTWINEAAALLREEIEKGRLGTGTGIFEGTPMTIGVSDANNAVGVFDGFMDYDTYQEISTVEVRCGVKKTNGMNSLVERLEATTYGELNRQGLFPVTSFVDVPYVVEKEINVLEILMMSITIYQMVKEVIDSVKRIVNGITNVIKAATPDFAPLPIGQVGQIVSAILLIIFDIIITVLLIVAIINLLKQFFEAFISLPRNHRAAYQRLLLAKAVEHLGYGFESDIPELDQVVYLPTPVGEDTPILIGIPRNSDHGYFASDMFDLMHRHYNTKMAIVDGVVQFRPVDDPYWRRTSDYVLPNVNDETRKFNTEELIANRTIEFLTDVSDLHTIDNFTGTVIEVITRPKTVVNEEMVLIKGVERNKIALALGNRKNGLTDREQALKALAQFVDGLINTFGGNSSLAKQIDQRVGQLKLSETFHRIPKSIPFIGGKIPKDPRSVFSARTLEEKYHSEKSFVQNNFKRQRRLFNDKRIPFGFSDFLKLNKNSYFVTADGDFGKMVSFSWNLASDTATVTYWVEEKYTINLKEEIIEP